MPPTLATVSLYLAVSRVWWGRASPKLGKPYTKHPLLPPVQSTVCWLRKTKSGEEVGTLLPETMRKANP